MYYQGIKHVEGFLKHTQFRGEHDTKNRVETCILLSHRDMALASTCTQLLTGVCSIPVLSSLPADSQASPHHPPPIGEKAISLQWLQWFSSLQVAWTAFLPGQGPWIVHSFRLPVCPGLRYLQKSCAGLWWRWGPLMKSMGITWSFALVISTSPSSQAEKLAQSALCTNRHAQKQMLYFFCSFYKELEKGQKHMRTCMHTDFFLPTGWQSQVMVISTLGCTDGLSVSLVHDGQAVWEHCQERRVLGDSKQVTSVSWSWLLPFFSRWNWFS